MKIEIDEGDFKHGLLGLVVALVEVIQETLKLQAVRRMRGDDLSEAQVERLGSTLRQLEQTLADIKREQGIEEAVRSVRNSLDELADGSLLHVETQPGTENAPMTAPASTEEK